MLRGNSIIIMLLLCLPGCAKKRDLTFTQGQGINLDLVETWNHLTFDLDTGDNIGTSPYNHAENGIKIAEAVTSLNHFDLVEVKSTHPTLKTLLGNPPFLGRPNTHGVYQIQTKLTQHYLKLFKVGHPEDFPFEEKFYQEGKLNDGRILIPVLGYRIKSYYRIESKIDETGQNTNLLIEISEPDPEKATHVKIDWSSRELFQASEKNNLLPSSLFFGENLKPYTWYYSETITEKSLKDDKGLVGETTYHNDKSMLTSATKVKFIPRENELRVVNIARDERLDPQNPNESDLNHDATLIIPINWVEYQTKTEGTDLGLKDEQTHNRSWKKRNFFETQFSNLESSAIANGRIRLLDVEVDQNYFSFTVQNLLGNAGKTIHYSFLRADQKKLPYAPKPSSKIDQKIFGYFTTQRPFISNWEYYSEDDFQQRIFMSRMNPAQNEIIFHLSAESPPWLEEPAKKAVQAWNDAFEEALSKSDHPIHIRFSNTRVRLGDLRYHVIHLVDTLNEDGLLGFGPSITDPDTGEIIAATSNVFVNSIQALTANSIREYLIQKVEKQGVTHSILLPPVPKITPEGTNHAQLLLSETTHLEDLKKKFNQINLNSCTYAASQSTTAREIENFCPEIKSTISKYATSENQNLDWQKFWNETRPFIKECSKILAKEKILSTLIHEMGHNFGLRHNFYGSYDQTNYKKIKTVFNEKTISKSSSVMEYPAWDDDQLNEAGPYDIAAIRYGYANQVELSDGSLLSLKSNQNLKSLPLKPYLFCTDEDAILGLTPLCRMNDSGSSPEALADYYIQSFHNSLLIQKQRRMRPSLISAEDYARYVNYQYFIPLHAIYDEWRYKLGAFVQKQNQYLSDFSESDYEFILKSMEKDPLFSSDFQKYYQASRKIYTFFKSIAYGSNQYCIIDSLGKIKVIEFEKLRNEIRESSKGFLSIQHCLQANSFSALDNLLKLNHPKVIQEIGDPVHSYRFNPPETLEENLIPDVMGNESVRIYASLLLNARLNTPKNILNEFKPSFTDEPHFFKDQSQLLMNRLINGIQFHTIGLEEPLAFFTQENVLLKNLAKFFLLGITVPGERNGTINQIATQKRLLPFKTYIPKPGEKASDFSNSLIINNQLLYASHHPDEILSQGLIKQYQHNEAKKIAASPTFVLEFSQLKKSFLNEAEPLSAPLESILIFENKLFELKKIFGSDPIMLAKEHLRFNPLLTKLYPILDADFKEAQKKGVASIESFAKQNLRQYIQSKLPNEPVQFNSDAFSPYLDFVEKTNQEQKELEAQNSLILEVLSIYAN